MKISEKIEGYDSMSAEEKLSALEALEVDEPKDDTKLKQRLNEACAEAKKYKDQLKEKMSEEEKAKQEIKEREALLEQLLKEKTIAEQKANFLRVGYSEDMATKSATALADGDFETIFKNLNEFISERDKQAKIKEIQSTPLPTAGSTVPELTKEQFNKMSFAERNALYEKNKELYESLTKGD